MEPGIYVLKQERFKTTKSNIQKWILEKKQPKPKANRKAEVIKNRTDK